MNAKLHDLKRIFFGGFFIRGHPYRPRPVSVTAPTAITIAGISPCKHRHGAGYGAVYVPMYVAVRMARCRYTMDTISWGVNFWSKGNAPSRTARTRAVGAQRRHLAQRLSLACGAPAAAGNMLP